MFYRKLRFVGGGRIVRIILNGLQNQDALPEEIEVIEIDQKAAEILKHSFPAVQVVNQLSELEGR
ncbi:MAG: hypothetical protein QME85_07005 [Candidatus Saccharicenans sp.]|nr:hypothetical protein [Candidatus Saccharicenans sp.]MDI6848780.1 hypothetical protein [Candidatus Saccharicenans sp.]